MNLEELRMDCAIRIGYRKYFKTIQMELITKASEAVNFEHNI